LVLEQEGLWRKKSLQAAVLSVLAQVFEQEDLSPPKSLVVVLFLLSLEPKNLLTPQMVGLLLREQLVQLLLHSSQELRK